MVSSARETPSVIGNDPAERGKEVGISALSVCLSFMRLSRFFFFTMTVFLIISGTKKWDQARNRKRAILCLFCGSWWHSVTTLTDTDVCHFTIATKPSKDFFLLLFSLSLLIAALSTQGPFICQARGPLLSSPFRLSVMLVGLFSTEVRPSIRLYRVTSDSREPGTLLWNLATCSELMNK